MLTIVSGDTPYNAAKALLGSPDDDARSPTALQFVASVQQEVTKVTRAELRTRMHQVAQTLVANTKVGDRVLVALPTSLDFVATVLASLWSGRIAIPTAASLTPRELEFIVNDAEPAIVVTHAPQDLPPGSQSLAMHLPDPRDRATGECGSRSDTSSDGGPSTNAEPNPSRMPAQGDEPRDPLVPPHSTVADTPALLIYTSGSTAAPKGVLHAHRAIDARRLMQRAWTGIRSGDVVLHAGRLNWTYTLGIAVFDTLAARATGVVHASPDNTTNWRAIIDFVGASVFATVPSVYRRFLRDATITPASMPTLRHALTAGERLSPSLAHAWNAAVGRPIYEALGMTECSTYISRGPDISYRPGSVGVAQPGRRVTLVPLASEPTQVDQVTGEERDVVGELAIDTHDPGLLLSYWRRPDETREAFRHGHFMTGDIVRRDADGYLYVVGRADELLNCLGTRIAPAEIEAVLRQIPGVADVAVGARRVRDDLELVAAYLVAEPGLNVRREDVEAILARDLAPFKHPKVILQVSSIPRTPNGKIQRHAIATLSGEELLTTPTPGA